MDKLKESWKDWDFYFEQVLKAAAADENGLEGVARFLNVDILTSLAGAPAGVCCSASTAVRAFAVGSQAARKVVYAVSGVGIICGVMDAVGGFSGAWRGDSEGADLLDAYADQICAVLHTMLAAAASTPAHAELAGKVPHLVLVEVGQGTLPKPKYRLGDWTKKRWNGGPRDVNAYFTVALGEGRTRRTEQSIRVSPGRHTELGARLLTRIFEHDTSLAVAAFSERSAFTKATVGDPRMGPVHVVDLAKVHLPFSNYISTGGGGSMLWLSCRRPT